jgi:hypothetical protein
VDLGQLRCAHDLKESVQGACAAFRRRDGCRLNRRAHLLAEILPQSREKLFGNSTRDFVTGIRDEVKQATLGTHPVKRAVIRAASSDCGRQIEVLLEHARLIGRDNCVLPGGPEY